MSTKVNEIVMVNGIEVDTDKAQKMMRKIIINCYAGQGNSLVLYR